MRPGAALAALALLQCCLCEAATEFQTKASSGQVNATIGQANAMNASIDHVNATISQANVTSDTEEAGAKRALQKVMRWVRRVLQGGDYQYPGGEVGLEGSDADYMVNEERIFRGSAFRDLEDNTIRGLSDFGVAGDREFVPITRVPEIGDRGSASGLAADASNRERTPETLDRNTRFETGAKDFEPEVNVIQNTSPTPNYTNNDGRVFPTTEYNDLQSPVNRDFAASQGSVAASQELSPSVAGGGDGTRWRWLNILAEFLRMSREGRELLRAQAGQLLEGVDLESGQLPRPVLLLPVPVEINNPAVRPVDDDDDFHRTLLELFRQARPRAPLLPPLLLPDSPRPVPAAPLPPVSPAPPPARLRFDRSLMIRADLTVFFSDYTEPYTVWYDAESGSSRVDMHGGTTVLYRAVQPGGDVQRVQFRIERFGDDAMRRCTWLNSRAVAADRALPALPDPTPFSFTGYQDTVDGRMERWSYTLAGQAGELGAARGEALVFRHELLVARVQPDFAIPYKYRVTVDSSVLGPEADWYEHRYLEVREQRPDAAHLRIDVNRSCDLLQRADRVDQVDPLREYVMTHRDSRCDIDFERFKETHQINYEDPVDEAVRKTLLIRSTRFVESANRQGATARMENNPLGVMLPAELRTLGGTRPEDSRQAGEDSVAGEGEGDLGEVPISFGTLMPMGFPYSDQEVRSMAAQLPADFSWKKKGGVTHIRNQGQCTACWAFAVVCAVEGALFRLTNTLVPLSDQQLADCTRSKRSCTQSGFVRNAYHQANTTGIVALNDYPRYMYTDPKLQQCRKKATDPVVTKITGYVQVPSNTAAVKVAIINQGPVVMEVDSSCKAFIYYDSGVLQDKRCDPNARNHAVAAIGYSRHKTVGDYFIIKNSWGLAGRAGFVHLHADSNTAGVLSAPTYPVLEQDDIPNRGSLGQRAATYPDEPNIYKTQSDAAYEAFLKEQKTFLATTTTPPPSP